MEKKISITELFNGPRVEIRSSPGHFLLAEPTNNVFGDQMWLQTQSGEGMTIPNEVLYEFLDDYFKKNF